MARSKEFDENEVLDKAMKLFWEQGYEKTSMSDLVEHMGIHRRSLYDTFTDKHTLFLKALERFSSRSSARLAAGIKQAETASKALQFVYDSMIEGEEDAPPGCMIVNSAVELAVRDAEVDARTSGIFGNTEQTIKEIIVWGQQTGEFTNKADAGELAEYVHNTLAGLRVMRRTSAAKEKLRRIADLSMGLLQK